MHHPKRVFIICCLLVLTLTPVSAQYFHLTRHWVNIPCWDEWGQTATVLEKFHDGTLTVGNLFQQHNEARMAFPKMLFIAVAQFGGWDVRRVMILTFFAQCAILLALHHLLWKTTGAIAEVRLLVVACFSVFVFSPIQDENSFWAFMISLFMPVLALLGALCFNLSEQPLPRKTAVSVLMSFIGTFSIANGMLLWFLAMPIPTDRDLRERSRGHWLRMAICYLVHGAAAVGTITFYFWDYKKPQATPPLALSLDSLEKVASYLMAWVAGTLYSAPTGPVRSVYPDLLPTGGIVIAVFVTAFTAALSIVYRTKNWRPFYPWFVIGLYSLTSGTITAVGRVGFGLNQALASRYTTLSVLLYVSVIALLFQVYWYAVRGHRYVHLYSASIGLLVGLLLPPLFKSYARGRDVGYYIENARKSTGIPWAWCLVIPDNPDLSLLFPDPKIPVARTAALLRQGLLDRSRFYDPSLAQAIAAGTNSSKAGGNLEEVRVMADHRLYIRGHAIIPDTRLPADAVIIGYRPEGAERVVPYYPVDVGQSREDVAEYYKTKRLLNCGFEAKVPNSGLPAGAVVIKAWAVDKRRTLVFPLMSEIPVPQG